MLIRFRLWLTSVAAEAVKAWLTMFFWVFYGALFLAVSVGADYVFSGMVFSDSTGPVVVVFLAVIGWLAYKVISWIAKGLGKTMAVQRWADKRRRAKSAAHEP